MSLLALLLAQGPAHAQQVASEGGGGGWLDTPAWLGTDAGDEEGEGVVGGKQVKDGKWDDAVGVVFAGAYVGCTGTLIGPKVVLTAGHCVGGYPITHVMVGSKDWYTDEGELVEVDEVFEYPNSQSSYDIAVLTLRTKAKAAEPRPVAVDCILKDHLDDGAKAQIVGFGVTSESGRGFNSLLNEAATTVLDKNCDESQLNGVYTGCQPSVSPGGEIAAGGDGTDACYGDSGGPLYLKTDVGDYLVGVTSRAFLGVDPDYPCRDGGIWVRPDAVIDWIEEKAGNRDIAYPACNEAPEVVVDDILTWERTVGAVQVTVVDPDGEPDGALVEIVQEPEHGAAQIGTDGVLAYTPDEGFFGTDTVTISVTDAGNDRWDRTGAPITVELDVNVVVQQGRPPGLLGCATTGSPAAWVAVPLALLALCRRSQP